MKKKLARQTAHLPTHYLVPHRHFCSKTKTTSNTAYQLLCTCEPTHLHLRTRIWLTPFSYAFYVLQNHHKIVIFRPFHHSRQNSQSVVCAETVVFASSTTTSPTPICTKTVAATTGSVLTSSSNDWGPSTKTLKLQQTRIYKT